MGTHDGLPRVEVASVPARRDRRNEDYAAVSLSGVAVVLDGVTPPVDGDTGCQHGVSWFAERLGGALLDLAGARRNLCLADCLADAIGHTATAHDSTCDLSHRRTPQATVAALRWDADRIEYLVLSDAALLLAGPTGVVTPVLDSRLDKLRARPDLRVLRREANALPQGSAARETAVRAYRETMEALRNEPGGFFTAAADPEVAGRAVTGSMPRAEVRAAAAFTDGATRWTEVFGLGDWSQLFGMLRVEGARALIDRVRAAEAADPEGTAFPRGKAYDDASVVYLEF